MRRARLSAFGFEIGTFFGTLAGEIGRIGGMGYVCRKANVRRGMTALKTVLRRSGCKLPAGAAVAALYNV